MRLLSSAHHGFYVGEAGKEVKYKTSSTSKLLITTNIHPLRGSPDIVVTRRGVRQPQNIIPPSPLWGTGKKKEDK